MSHPRRRLRLTAAAAFLAAAAVGLPSPPADAQATHVAVVVDFGAQGGTTAHCSPGGGSGFSVLTDGYTVATNKTGLVTKINSVGLDSPPKDLYWSYWHDTGSGWRYASTGPATYSPPAGSIDGWVYGDGKTPPPSASYASVCAGRDPAPPPPPRSTGTTAHPTPPSTHHTSPRTSPPPSRTTSADRPTGRDSTPRSTPAGSTRTARTTPTPTPTASGTAAPTASGTSPTSSDSVIAAAPPKADDTSRSGIPPWGTALAIVVVAALGALAFWRTRAQRQRSP